MSASHTQDSLNHLVYTFTKLNTTKDGLVDQNHLQPISKGSCIKLLSEERMTLFEGYYNFISILKMQPNEIIYNYSDMLPKYYIDIQNDLKKKIRSKFSFYSIANDYDPNTSFVENLENNSGIQIFPKSRVKFGIFEFDLLPFVNELSNLRNELNNIMNEFDLNNCESIRNHEECYQPDSINPDDVCKICLLKSTLENPLVTL